MEKSDSQQPQASYQQGNPSNQIGHSELSFGTLKELLQLPIIMPPDNFDLGDQTEKICKFNQSKNSIIKSDQRSSFSKRLNKLSVDQRINDFHSLFEKGKDFQRAKKYKEAMRQYKRARKLDNKNIQLYYRLVEVCQLQKISSAKKWAQKLIRLDPKAASSQLVQRIKQKYLKNQINKRQKSRQDPCIPNPTRVGHVHLTKLLQQKSLDQLTSNHKQAKQLEKQESILNSSESYKRTQQKAQVSIDRLDIEKLKSKPPRQIQNHLEYPYSAVGLIKAKFWIEGIPRIKEGSACLIGTNILLTAAHTIYRIKEKLQSVEIFYIPASEFPKGTVYRAKKCFIPLQYNEQSKFDFINKQLKSDLYDYALIYLDTEQNLEQKYGSLSYDFNWQQTAQNLRRLSQSNIIQNIKIIGFPWNQKKEPEFKEFQGDALNNKDYLQYRHPIMQSGSGAPIIEFENDLQIVRAVHNRSLTTNNVRSRVGLKLRSDMFEILYKGFRYPVRSYDYSKKVKYSKQLRGKQMKLFIEEINTKQQQYKQQYKQIGERHKIQVNLNKRNIGPLGCRQLVQAQWHNLQTLYLTYNNIGVEGCEHLVSAHWPYLQIILLTFNNIGNQGCQLLSYGKWFNLHTIDLSFNDIGDKGCTHLASAQWNNLQKFYLWGNKKISEQSKKLLRSPKFKAYF